MIWRELVEFVVGLATDDTHGGAFRISAALFGLDLGLDRLKINKPGFENGLGYLLQGLVYLTVY